MVQELQLRIKHRFGVSAEAFLYRLNVETTGLSSQSGDRVIEIGAVATENQSIVKDRNLKTLPAGKIFAFEANNAYNRFKL